MVKEVIEIMPKSGSKEDIEIALFQKSLVDELAGIKNNGIIDHLIDMELENLLKN